jgi:hypothetical protein
MVWTLVVHLPFRPLPGPTHFLCLAKESKQRKARPRWRHPPWIFVTGRRRGKLASLKQFPAFFPPAHKNPRRHLGQGKAKTNRWSACPRWRLVNACCYLLPLLASCLLLTWWTDGLAVPCPMRRLEFLLQGGKRKGNCLSAASFPLPLLATEIQGVFRRIGRAFLCLLSLARQRK